MLSTVELVMNSFVFVLLPLTVHSMITGALPPQTTWLGRIYGADTRLLLVSNLFLLAVCVSSLVRLTMPFRPGRQKAADPAGDRGRRAVLCADGRLPRHVGPCRA